MAQLEAHPLPTNRLVLGTAQLGMAYGIANQTGRPAEREAHRVVASAVARGFAGFDTAAAYGDSEVVLGRAFAALGVQHHVRVVSKGSWVEAAGETLTTRVETSLQRLGVPRLRAWLLHDQQQIAAWTPEVATQADALRRSGRVEAFGLSAYHPERALRAIEQHGFTALQFPASPLDRRFLREPVIGRLARAGMALFVRSVYLQGLCLLPPAHVPAGIARGREAVQTLHNFCLRRGLARDHFCLHYVFQRTAAVGARLVVGVESPLQLERNAALLSAPPLDPAHLEDWDALWPEDIDELVLPYRWPARGEAASAA